MVSRRQFLSTSLQAGLALGATSLLPAWSLPASRGNTGLSTLTGNRFDLKVDRFPVTIGGRSGMALGVNGTVPAPLIRFREGEEITLNVTNTLDEDTSIHWHGLLVPFQMDGVPGVTFPGIRPGETFQYKFAVPQNGTYWYHSHSGLQEQLGHYGPIIIEPKGADPVGYDREYIMVLSDWSFEDPYRIFKKLKTMSETYNFSHRTVPDFIEDAGEKGFGTALEQRAMWGGMRMSPRDIADVTGATYHFLINGHSTADNWNAVFNPGERVRLRIINASAMSIFNVRIPGLPMTVVQADGLHVRPLEVDEFQIGVAETYDVIVQPKDEKAYAFTAESIDRSGQVVATLGPRPGMKAKEPALRAVPTLTMKDMAMDHGSMDMGGDTASGGMKMAGMDHDMKGHDMDAMSDSAEVKRGPGVTKLAAMPMSRLDEPGLGLEDVPHRTLRYSQLRSLEPNKDTRAPEREIEVHLTSNMERYMWSFDGVKFSEVTEPIIFHEGERVRMTMVNDTMMNHPIHLHGMFFDLVNGGGNHMPRKHTVIVKPGEKLSVDITAEHVGDWAFHCHLLYHMHAGMMQVVSVLPNDGRNKPMSHDHPPSHKASMQMDGQDMKHEMSSHDMGAHDMEGHDMGSHGDHKMGGQH
ncbi:copper resistance system multicopper oxidase [Parvularcula flava]|uniref:Copper resistance system multicopper oxidase n=2 Tax=Aquisalinus luteolus TaxID=1566827 RepID=A0ABX0HQ49_9PROT|nr:copper resistance system multicopper oxidase [Aquisalinus luteolus]NHK29686.1 copper resistance system multicopper oxidase [Aquisalinus luteolus]